LRLLLADARHHGGQMNLSHIVGKLLGGRYRVEGLLGRGAFGHTFLASD
jgi:hypothetical protein